MGWFGAGFGLSSGKFSALCCSPVTCGSFEQPYLASGHRCACGQRLGGSCPRKAGVRCAPALLSFIEVMKWCLFPGGSFKMFLIYLVTFQSESKAPGGILGGFVWCLQVSSLQESRAVNGAGALKVCLILSCSPQKLSWACTQSVFLAEEVMASMNKVRVSWWGLHSMSWFKKNPLHFSCSAYGCWRSQRSSNYVQVELPGIRGIKRAARAIPVPELTAADSCPLCMALTCKS